MLTVLPVNFFYGEGGLQLSSVENNGRRDFQKIVVKTLRLLTVVVSFVLLCTTGPLFREKVSYIQIARGKEDTLHFIGVNLPSISPS